MLRCSLLTSPWRRFYLNGEKETNAPSKGKDAAAYLKCSSLRQMKTGFKRTVLQRTAARTRSDGKRNRSGCSYLKMGGFSSGRRRFWACLFEFRRIG